MKRKWEVQRTGVQQLDGQRRWDIAYQQILHWTNEVITVSDEGDVTIITQEVKDENCHLRSCFNPAATTEPNH